MDFPDGYHEVVNSAKPIKELLEKANLPLAPCHCDPLCENFLDDGCDNYPITIQIKMGFEGENLSNPIRNWSDRQFDLDKNNEFRFECERDVSIKKKSGNTLQLEAKSGNFKFSLKGFHKISDYDIAVQDKEI